MKHKIFLSFLFLLSTFFFFPSKSFAITCGDEGTAFACGSAGGCPERKQACVGGNGYKYSCVTITNPDDCNVICGDEGSNNLCGSAGGCGEGYVCTNGSCVAGACPTPTVDPMTCTLPGCLNKSCNPGLDCMDPLICDTSRLGGICVESIVPIVTSSGNIFDVYCVQGKPESGINTALGCIDVSSPQNLITIILRIATGAGGGIALILILYGVFIVTTSAGNPDKLKSGSEIITSAIIGLIFVLLSVFLVNLIGINILGIPGLS